MVKPAKNLIRTFKASKYAFLLSYNGSEFSGLQWQSSNDVRTIEKCLWEALFETKLIKKSNLSNDCHSLQFSRASRTDKGVSALRQVLSGVLENYHPDKLWEINHCLPEDVVLHDVVATIPSFDAWDWASKRHYSYLLPTYALAHIHSSLGSAVDYRIPIDHLWFTRKCLLYFLGGHNFINFTDKKKLMKEFRSKEAFLTSCYRYISSATIDDPFVYKGTQFCRVHFKGDSFILHQIRKMITLLVALTRGVLSESSDLLSFGKRHIYDEQPFVIPLAPGFPLVLEKINYENYNRQIVLMNSNNARHSFNTHSKIDFSSHEDEIKCFERECIVPSILEEEVSNRKMLKFSNEVAHFVPQCNRYLKEYRTWANDLRFREPRLVSF